MKIQKLDDVIDARGIKALVYGASGTGKTRLIESLPGRVLVASAEAGMLSLRGLGGGRIDVVEITSIDGLREVYSHVKRTAHGYDWIALDSVSEIAEVCLTEQKKLTKDPRAAYGAIQDEVGGILRAFRDLDVGVYFSAKEHKEKDDSTGRTSYGLSMPGAKLGAQVPYLFDLVMRLVVVSDKDEAGNAVDVRWLQTANDGRSVAKDRSGRLEPFELADPTSGDVWGLGAIVEKIRGTPAKRARKSTGVEAALSGIDEQHNDEGEDGSNNNVVND